MKIELLPEPELQFGTNNHIDIRHGLMQYGPLDFEHSLVPERIKVGIVGTQESLEGIESWFERCRTGIPAKNSKQPNLFTNFPGFGSECILKPALTTSAQLQRAIPIREIERLCKICEEKKLICEAVNLYISEFEYLIENSTPDVLLCAIPMELLNAMNEASTAIEEVEDDAGGPARMVPVRYDFHHLFKSRAMSLNKVSQLILPPTYDSLKTRVTKTKQKSRSLQDEATRAWNFYVALYYKVGGTPWRIIRAPDHFATCFIGISFYHSLDKKTVQTSMAQVFNQRGDGVVVRGAAAVVSKEDRQPRLSEKDAHDLVLKAIHTFRMEHRHLPARVVIHKTSNYNAAELAGFRHALEELRIEMMDFLSLEHSSTRLFRHEIYPPLRGLLTSFDSRSHLLYTRGSINYFQTYPGQYVPRPLMFHCDQVESTPRFLGNELLELTKMNWNNTQFDGGDPITTRAAKQVGSILKYFDPNETNIKARYSFYM